MSKQRRLRYACHLCSIHRVMYIYQNLRDQTRSATLTTHRPTSAPGDTITLMLTQNLEENTIKAKHLALSLFLSFSLSLSLQGDCNIERIHISDHKTRTQHAYYEINKQLNCAKVKNLLRTQTKQALMLCKSEKCIHVQNVTLHICNRY